MKLAFWKKVQQMSGILLTVSAVVLLSTPRGSAWKVAAGVACSVFGLVCLVTMYIMKEPDKVEEFHLVSRDMNHYDDGRSGSHGDLSDD